MSSEDCFHLGVKALICSESKKILLLERGNGKWEIPGGRLQKGEQPKKALLRELREEVGIESLEEVTLLDTFLTNTRIPLLNSEVGLILSVYLYPVQEVFTPQLSEEHINYKWVTMEEFTSELDEAYPYPPSLLEKLAQINEVKL